LIRINSSSSSNNMSSSSDDHVAKCVQSCKSAFATGRTKPVSFRKQQLRALLRLLQENEELICDAAKTDLGRSPEDTWMMEYVTVNNEIVDALDNVDDWAADKPQSRSLMTATSSVYIRNEPYGVCLIMSAYNYPFSLLVNPLVAAIAAGNCAVLKTSEAAVATAQLLLKLLPCYLDKECYPVLNLDAVGSAALLKNHRFDKIFFTGGTNVGRLVMKAAAENLTPVVLELGGKNPCFVDHTCDVKLAAKRVCFAKFSNAGQICLSPDYVLCDARVKNELVAALKGWVREFYGADPQKCVSYARIISESQCERMRALIDSLPCNQVVCGGQVDVADKYVAPTVVVDAAADSPLMAQEMFGPILIVLTVRDVDAAIAVALQHEKPLALYAFSKRRSTLKRIMDAVPSGGVTLNDCMMHYIVPTLPFGGVGNSGTGAYHGKFGFEAFTHQRGVLDDGTPEILFNMRYPPMSKRKLGMVKLMALKSPRMMSQRLWSVLLFAMAIVAARYFTDILPF